MGVLNKVLSKYTNEPYEPQQVVTYSLSAKVNTDHQAILDSLIISNLVDSRTDALKLLIEAGFKYLCDELPEEVSEHLSLAHEKALEDLGGFPLED